MQRGKALTAKQHSPLEANSVLFHFIVPDLDCPVVFYSIFVSKGHLPQKRALAWTTPSLFFGFPLTCIVWASPLSVYQIIYQTSKFAQKNKKIFLLTCSVLLPHMWQCTPPSLPMCSTHLQSSGNDPQTNRTFVKTRKQVHHQRCKKLEILEIYLCYFFSWC